MHAADSEVDRLLADGWKRAMGEDVALAGPWAKIADEIIRGQQTVLTTFSISAGVRHLGKAADLLRR